MKVKRIESILIVCISAIILLTGCAGKKKDKKESEDPYYVTINNTDIRLGMDFKKVSKSLGDEIEEPYRSELMSGLDTFVWVRHTFKDVVLTVNEEDNTIVGIACGNSDNWTLAGKIGPQSTMDDVVKIFGETEVGDSDFKRYFFEQDGMQSYMNISFWSQGTDSVIIERLI